MSGHRIPHSAQSIRAVARAATALRQQAAEAIAAQQEAVARLDELIAGLQPAELAKAATRPALRFALQVIDDARCDTDQRLKAAALVLALGHANAPRQLDMTAKVDTYTVVTPEQLRHAALTLAAASAEDAP